MNKKLLLAALAVPMAFTACNEDFQVENPVSNETILKDGKIQLGDNFVLGVGRDNGVESKSAYISSGFTQMYWIPKDGDNVSLTDYSNGIPDGFVKDAIGLCYVNGNQILTNYKFDHDGWVATGESMKNEPFACVDGVRYYSRNYLRFPGMAENDAVIQTIQANETYRATEGILKSPISSAILEGDEDVKIESLNLARGIFKTEEKTIFAGDYVAYFPWSNAMLEAGNLIATSPVQMKYESGSDVDRINALNKYTFMAGWVGNIDGGTEAADMKLNQVSKLLGLRLHNVGSGYNKIVLLDPQGNFINKMELTIEQVKNGSAKGTAVEKSQTIMIDFDTEIDGYQRIVNGETHGIDARIYVPMFETNIPAGTYVLAVNSNTGETKYYQTTQAVDFTNVENLVKNLTSDCVTLTDFGYDVVTNETELIKANASASEKPILLLGDIELSEANTELKNKTLVGYIDDKKVGSLTLPAVDENAYLIKATNVVFDCDVNIDAPGCCHNYAGTLNMYGITLNADRTIENQNEVVFKNGHVNRIYGTFNNTPYVEPDEEGLSYKAVAPTMKIDAKTSVYVYGEMNNNDAEDLEGINIQSLIEIASDVNNDGTDRKDGELSVAVAGTLSNNAMIVNYGTMANQTGKQSNIMNNEGATYVLKIGGQLTGALLQNAANRQCDFIAEVDNATDSRWATAWSQGLANIIKIVKDQNTKYSDKFDAVYPFEFTLNDGTTMTVNNKNVQVIVENAEVWFVGKKTTGQVEEFTPVAATIGRLTINAEGGNTYLNLMNQNNNGSWKTIEPVQLTVDNSTWAGNESAAGESDNAVEVIAGTLQHNKYEFSGKTALKSIRLTVRGDFDVNGTYKEFAYLSQKGDLDALAGSVIRFEEDSHFNITGNIISEDATKSEANGIFIEERVQGDLTSNIEVREDSYVQVSGDAVIKVQGNVTNDGKMKWISRTGTKSPGVIYCASFSASDETNWVNGTPTLN